MRDRETKYRKRRHREADNNDRWMVSYADFITLLFVFFVVMYSISAANEGKYRVLSQSIINAFSRAGDVAKEKKQDLKKVELEPIADALSEANSPSQTEPLPVEKVTDPIESKENVIIKRMADSVENAMAPWIEKDLINVSKSPILLEIEINANALFSSGSATISSEASPILKGIANVLLPFPNAIHVEGFTDSVPIKTPEFPSNWELSAARSASIVRMFQESGIDPHRMAAVGFSEFRPAADNRTQQGRNRNRRIIIVVLSGNDPRNFIDIVKE